MGEYNVLHTKQLSQVPYMSPLDEQHIICPSIIHASMLLMEPILHMSVITYVVLNVQLKLMCWVFCPGFVS